MTTKKDNMLIRENAELGDLRPFPEVFLALVYVSGSENMATEDFQQPCDALFLVYLVEWVVREYYKMWVIVLLLYCRLACCPKTEVCPVVIFHFVRIQNPTSYFLDGVVPP